MSATEPDRLPWLPVLGAFTLLGLLSALGVAGMQRLEQRPLGLGTALVGSMPSWWFWGVAARPIFALSARHPLTADTWRRAIWVHAAAAVALVLLNVALTVAVARLVYPGGGQSWALWAAGYLTSRGAWNLLVYGGLVGVAHAVDARARLRRRELAAARLEAELARAQLHSLQLQLQPHFLFNTLHAIGVLTEEAPTRATRMIAALGDLLRASLATRATQEIPLERELALLRHYLDIESIRFSDRLSVTVDAAPAVGRHLVPTFLLQPLVENAVRHGVAVSPGPSRVRISGRAEGGELVLSVWNDGPPLDPDRIREGVGLATTRDRLRRLYGDRAGLELRDGDAGVEAVVRLPIHDDPVL